MSRETETRLGSRRRPLAVPLVLSCVIHEFLTVEFVRGRIALCALASVVSLFSLPSFFHGAHTQRERRR